MLGPRTPVGRGGMRGSVRGERQQQAPIRPETLDRGAGETCASAPACASVSLPGPCAPMALELPFAFVLSSAV